MPPSGDRPHCLRPAEGPLERLHKRQHPDLWVPPQLGGARLKVPPTQGSHSTPGSKSSCSGAEQTGLDRAMPPSLLPVLLLHLPLSNDTGRAELGLWEVQRACDPGG